MPEDLHLIKEMETLRKKTNILLEVLSEQKIDYKLSDSTFYSLLDERAGKVAFEAMQEFEAFIHQKYSFMQPFLKDFAEKRYMHTQSVAEARFVIFERSCKLVDCEIEILRNILFKQLKDKNTQPLIPFLQTEKSMHYEGDTLKGKVFLLKPNRFEKGKAKATWNGQPVEVAENGIAHIRFRAGKAGVYVGKVTFSCKYRGRDTTFSTLYEYKILPKTF